MSGIWDEKNNQMLKVSGYCNVDHSTTQQNELIKILLSPIILFINRILKFSK